MTLSSPTLADRFDVQAISPFGVLVRPRTADEDISEVPVAAARDLVREHRVLALRGFRSPATADDLADYAKAWGQIYHWPFGPVLELVEHDDPADHVFDSSGVSYHWDGMFKDTIPEFQIFQCVVAPEGGRTIFCDTTRVLATAAPSTRALWEQLELGYGIKQVVHYGGEVISPLVVDHPDRGYATMRYLEPVPADVPYVNRPIVRFPDHLTEAEVAEIKQTLRAALYDERNMYAHRWEPGDVVIADNYTNLHGREPYTSRCGRHLRRVHILGDPPFTNPALRST